MASLQRSVEDVCEHRRQLICTVLQGGWRDRVRTCCFTGVLPLKNLIYISFQYWKEMHVRCMHRIPHDLQSLQQKEQVFKKMYEKYEQIAKYCK